MNYDCGYEVMIVFTWKDCAAQFLLVWRRSTMLFYINIVIPSHMYIIIQQAETDITYCVHLYVPIFNSIVGVIIMDKLILFLNH